MAMKNLKEHQIFNNYVMVIGSSSDEMGFKNPVFMWVTSKFV